MSEPAKKPDAPDPQRLIELLNALLAAERAEKRRLLETEAEILLHLDAEALLRQEAEHPAAADDDEISRYFIVHADLLAACRERGVASVWQDLEDDGEPSRKSDELAGLIAELQAMLGEQSAEQEQGNLRRQIELCRRILALLSREQAADLWATVQGLMGNALQHLGALTGDAAVLREAEKAYRDALEEHTRDDAPMEWAMAHNNLGTVLARLGALTGDAAVLRSAEQAFRDALEERTRERAPVNWAMTQHNLGIVLARLGDLTGDAAVLRKAEQAFRDALLEYTRERAPIDWAMTQNNLGNVLQRLGKLTGNAALLRVAEQAYRDALLEYTRERAPVDWAMIQNNLGTVLSSLGELTGNAALLRKAEQAFRDALLEYTRDRAPIDWAMTQNNLGTVLRSLGELTGNAAVLRKAEQAFRDALLEYTREREAMDWAMTQNNLGNVLSTLGELTGDTAVLRVAEQAFRDALLEYTRERAPVDWAMIQNNLGTVLSSLGELTGNAALLRKAEQAFRDALLEYTRDRAPIDWAMTQNNLGTVLRSLGELTGDAALLRAAEQAFRDALQERTRDRAPMDWAATQNNLGNVLQILGGLTDDAAVLNAAEQAYRDALLEYTRERAPMNWGRTQNNLGTVLQRLGELTRDAAVLRKAEQAFRDALLEYTRERAPIDWAMTQNNLGNVMGSLGALTGDATWLGKAVAAYGLALVALESSGAEDDCQGTAARLARLLVRLDHHDQAAVVIVTALARSDAALLDAARGRDGTARAVERVGDLFGLLSLCRLRQDRPDRRAALIAADSGRARLLAGALALDAVRPEAINDPDIRAAIDAAWNRRAALRHVLGYDQNAVSTNDTVSRRELAPAKRAQLQAELRQATDAYVALCRQHGLIRTPEPLTFAEIVAAAPDGGALVLPVLTETTGFVFVVTQGMTEPLVLDLPRLDRGVVAAHLSGDDGWLGVYFEHFRNRADKDAAALAAAEARWHGQLTATLAWLWERLLAPVHQVLRGLRAAEQIVADAPVVMLAPGLLGLLPLHAAGPGPDGKYFGDHWTVNYAPSVRTLLTCRQRRKERARLPAKLLAVIDPPSEKRLLGAQQEVPMLRRHFAHAAQVILEDTDATLAAVLEHLPSATCFHASTHGWHDSLQPTQSGLHLADAPLLLEALHDTKLEAALLVFLSACESGLAAVRRLPQEFIGLPVGCVQAGAVSVVGSLWPIRDDAAFLLAGRFYDLHLDERGHERMPPVQALRKAQDWLRRLTFADLRKRFPVVEGADGTYLQLQTADRFEPPPKPPATEQNHGPPEPRRLLLRLGPDTDQPYAAAQHWAAFTVTGA